MDGRLKERYGSAMHRTQSALAIYTTRELQLEPGMETGDIDPEQINRRLKHLAVGNSGRASDHTALVGLLLDKGVISRPEYEEAVVIEAEREADRVAEWVKAKLGLPDGVTFG